MGESNVKSGSWKSLIIGGVCLLAALMTCACASQKKVDMESAPMAEVTSINVETGQDGDEVFITTSLDNGAYSVYKWVDPERVVVDMPNSVMKGVSETIPVANGLIQEIEVKPVSPSDDSDSSMVRVVINLEKSADYNVQRDGEKLVVRLDRKSGQAQDLDLFSKGSSLVVIEKDDSLQVATEEEDDWAWGGVSDGAPAEKTTVPGKGLVGLSSEEKGELTRVNVNLDGTVGDYSAFTLDNPSRLVIDLWGVKNSAKVDQKNIEGQGIKKVRAGEHPDKLRLVFDASGELPNYRFDKEGKSLVVTFSKELDLSASPNMNVTSISETSGTGAASTSAESDAASDIEWPEIKMAQADEEWSGPAGGSTASEWGVPIEPTDSNGGPEPSGTEGVPVEWGSAARPAMQEDEAAGVAYIDSIKFDWSNDASSIVIHADRPIRREQWTRDDNPNENIISVFISEAQVAADQQRSYDTTEFQSPVELFSVFQKPHTRNEVAIVIVMRDWAAVKWEQFGNKLVFSFENYPGSLGLAGDPTSGMFGPRGEILTGGAAEPGMGAPIGAPGQPGVAPAATGATQYSGALVSLDFKNLDVLDALRTIAEVSGMNIVVSDAVKGNVTLKLDNVPWDQALDLILDLEDLAKVEEGNIVRIDTKERMQSARQEKLAELEADKKIERLQTKIIPVNYVKSQELLQIIKPMMTQGRGEASSHKSTNTLIIRDIPDTVEEVEDLVRRLDIPTKQVLIEARIVEATIGVTREIGVQWGTDVDLTASTGYPTGLDFPGPVQVGGAVLGGSAGAASAPILSRGGGALGMSIGSLSGVVDLDVALRALETQERIKIISSPRVVTLSDQEASIEQGVSIPYPPPSNISGNSQWQFVNATLSLKVTPHVAADNSILMDVEAQNNEPVSVIGAQSPGISTKETQTSILLQNGETAVIGGIFKVSQRRPKTQVPFLGELPIIGRLFSQEVTEDRNEEMLIFLTPRIINPEEPELTVGQFGTGQ